MTDFDMMKQDMRELEIANLIKEGKAAFKQGLPLTANPYSSIDRYDARHWTTGWENASKGEV